MKIPYLRGFCSSAIPQMYIFTMVQSLSPFYFSSVFLGNAILSSDYNHLHVTDVQTQSLFLLFSLPAGYFHPIPYFSISKKEYIHFLFRIRIPKSETLHENFLHYIPDFGKQYNDAHSNSIRNVKKFP